MTTNLHLVGHEPQTERILLPHEQEGLDIINSVESYAWAMGTLGGKKTGFVQFDRNFGGLQPALIIVAGASNVGKSAFVLQLAWQVATLNEDVYCIYISLDDRDKEIMPRIVAMDQRIPIACATTPGAYDGQNALLSRRKVGFDRMREHVTHFKMLDQNHLCSIEEIEDVIRAHKVALADSGKQLCLFIDNFYDIQVRDIGFKDDNSKYEHIVTELNRLCEAHDTPIVCTAEFRKLNGTRRPINDDIRDTVKIVYKAKLTLLAYNEVGLRGESANVYFEIPGQQEKQAVLELKVGKNKVGSFKGRLFYEFFSEQSFLREVPLEGCKRYNSLITN